MQRSHILRRGTCSLFVNGPHWRGDRARFRPVSRLEQRALLTVTWVGSGSGNWDDPSNWSSGTVPGPADDVAISQTGITVTHSSNVDDSIKSLTTQAEVDITSEEAFRIAKARRSIIIYSSRAHVWA